MSRTAFPAYAECKRPSDRSASDTRPHLNATYSHVNPSPPAPHPQAALPARSFQAGAFAAIPKSHDIPSGPFASSSRRATRRNPQNPHSSTDRDSSRTLPSGPTTDAPPHALSRPSSSSDQSPTVLTDAGLCRPRRSRWADTQGGASSAHSCTPSAVSATHGRTAAARKNLYRSEPLRLPPTLPPSTFPSSKAYPAPCSERSANDCSYQQAPYWHRSPPAHPYSP